MSRVLMKIMVQVHQVVDQLGKREEGDFIVLGNQAEELLIIQSHHLEEADRHQKVIIHRCKYQISL